MSSFIKYSLLNIIFWGIIGGLTYWYLGKDFALSSNSDSVEERLTQENIRLDTLFTNYKKAVNANDVSKSAQSKVELDNQMEQMRTLYFAKTAFNQLASSLLTNNEKRMSYIKTANQNTTNTALTKKNLQSEITSLKSETQELTMKLMIESSKPAPIQQ